MRETEIKIQEQLRSCLEYYAMLVSDTYHANESLENRDFVTMLVNGQAITARASRCEDVFKSSSNPSYLTDRNLKMAILGQMIATLSTKIE
ncbi:hypothetical protein FRX31_029445 [Thalictrum thalictroides]|uniref:Uncharacterized protein n=1 Tax=Thalictrum thalictroides TaxID=46969 RepID=A0A7J6V8G7_THATH|nr:hypothetical protein FRX31_029445 [Thalictrum thalictroides]